MINRWLNESNEDTKEREVNNIIHQIHDLAIENSLEENQKSFVINIPENKDIQNKLNKIYPKSILERTPDNQMIIANSNPAVKLLKELKQLAKHRNKQNEFIVKIEELKEDYSRLSALKLRIDKIM